MRKIPSLGEQEMELLKFIGEQAPVSVRDVTTYFEQEKNLARTTVLTVMERLRKKGFLSRAKIDGIYKYSAKFETEDVIRSKVSDFVEKTLGGSLSPLISYFMDSSNLTDEELLQLQELNAKLEQRKGEDSL